MDRTELRAAFAAAAKATRDAGKLALSYFHRPNRLIVEQKGPQDFVTVADREVERFLIERLHLVHRDAVVLAEESAPTYSGSGEPVWLIDPIDGTGNFVRGIPLFCTSVALWEEGAVRLGLIYDPVRDEMYEALEGEGAFVNGRAIRASATQEAGRAVVGIGRSLKTPQEPVAQALTRVLEMGLAARMIGTAALAASWVAAGRLDGFFEAELKAWDIGAAVRIALEAGCEIDTRLDEEALRHGTPFLVAAPAVVDVIRRASGLREA